MPTDNCLSYHCMACSWSGETLTTDEWRCPQCGESVGATAMVAEAQLIDGPRELVLSLRQCREGLPLEVWETLRPRIADRELTIDPSELARAIGRFRLLPPPPPGKPRGRPPGSGYFSSSEDFLQKLLQYMRKLIREPDGMKCLTIENVALLIGVSVRQIHRKLSHRSTSWHELKRQVKREFDG